MEVGDPEQLFISARVKQTHQQVFLNAGGIFSSEFLPRYLHSLKCSYASRLER